MKSNGSVPSHLVPSRRHTLGTGLWFFVSSRHCSRNADAQTPRYSTMFKLSHVVVIVRLQKQNRKHPQTNFGPPMFTCMMVRAVESKNRNRVSIVTKHSLKNAILTMTRTAYFIRTFQKCRRISFSILTLWYRTRCRYISSHDTDLFKIHLWMSRERSYKEVLTQHTKCCVGVVSTG